MTPFDSYALSQRSAAGDRNEDFYAIDPDLGAFIVADGMGGRPAGDVASQTAVATFLHGLRQAPADQRLDATHLRSIVTLAHAAVRSRGEVDPLLAGLGSTLSAVILGQAGGRLVHVGDGQILRIRGPRSEPLTRPHNLAAELVAVGRLTPEQAVDYPLRNVLTHSLGAVTPPEPDIDDVSLEDGDWLVLSTDGLTKVVSPTEIQEIVMADAQAPAQRVACRIMEAATARQPDDDVTLIVLRRRTTGA